MKPSLYAMAAIAFLAACPAHAQLTVDMSKVTCKQFVTYEITDARSLSIWLSGYFNAQQNNMVVDVSKFRSRSNALKEFCLTHQDLALMEAAKTVIGSNK
jgi:acid stress chaperone HdeB